MSGRSRWVAFASFIIILVSVSVWWFNRVSYEIPTGPELPPQAPDKQFAESVIALNNQAMEQYMQSQDLEATLSLLDQALEIDPEYYRGYSNKASLLLRKNRYTEAAACFEILAELRPRRSLSYIGHALCLQRLGKEKEAQEKLLYALSASNNQVKESSRPFFARYDRSMVLFLLGHEAIAMRELDDLEGENAETAPLVKTLRKSMNECKSGDRWSILGLEI